MTIIDNEMLWRQFGAAINMLGDALHDCPDELWEKNLDGRQARGSRGNEGVSGSRGQGESRRLAERAGFEPADPKNGVTRLAI